MTDNETTRVEVLPVPEGSIVWLHNVDFDPATIEDAQDAMLKAVGHDRFVLLFTHGAGIVEVLGLDEIVAKVRAAIEASEPWTPCGFGEHETVCDPVLKRSRCVKCGEWA